MKENIKIALLGLIAVTLIVDTFFMDESSADQHLHNPAPISNAVAQNNPINEIAPTPAEPTGPTTTVEFAEKEYSFGNIKQDTENKKTFTFKNTGDEPLIISNAKGSCGCTVPDYPREPIAPGESGEINVVYKPGKQKGPQTKTVTITANTDPVQTILYIKADVEEIPGQEQGS